jgi:hypothetical protein
MKDAVMEPLIIRRNGLSCYITIPPEFIRQHNLKPRDVLGWKSRKDGATLTVVARVPEQEPAPEQEPEAT